MRSHFMNRRSVFAAVLFAGLALPGWTWVSDHDDDKDDHKPNAYRQTNLVSDQAGRAEHVDIHLLNAWGLYFSPTGPFWVNNNGTGTATVYDADGNSLPAGNPLVVTVPRPTGSTAPNSAPTGGMFNSFNAFMLSNGKNAVFLFVTEDGTISGWNPQGTPAAVVAVDNSSLEAVYKGGALGVNGGAPFLYAANFHAGTIDVYNGSFAKATLSGSFTDPNLPAGFAPFNIANIGGQLFVSYAKQNAERHDDVAAPGNGFVNVFDTNGNFIRRFASAGTLNSPWGMTRAPQDFGTFSGALLIGNFGDGKINAFDAGSGKFLGQLHTHGNHDLTIDGLWALAFGNGGAAGATNVLFFTAGPGDEKHGLFGKIAPRHRDKDDDDGDDDKGGDGH